MKISRKVLLFILIFQLSCSTSSEYMKQGISLNAYRYVYVEIPQYKDQIYDKFGVGRKLKTLFSSKGFIVLTSDESKNLPFESAGQYLYCKIHHESTVKESTVRLYLLDYRGDLIYSSEGSFGFRKSVAEDLIIATEFAFKPIEKEYTGFNPSLATDIVAEMNNRFSNWETIQLNELELKKYFDKKEILHPIEGIWTETQESNYRIGIISDSIRSDRDFVAFILSTNHPMWVSGQVKAELSRTAYPNVFTINYFMGDHQKQSTTAVLTDNAILSANLKTTNGESLTLSFIKNYPIGGSNSSVVASEKVSLGSGVIISTTGIVCTNWHVVAEKEIIEVNLPLMNKTFVAKVILKDSKNDIAILRLNDFDYQSLFKQPIPFALAYSKYAAQGQNVFTLGYPLSTILGQHAKLSDGIISALYGFQDDPRLMQITNPVQPGNSGGPLFTLNGQLIGLVVSSLNAKYLFENENILPQNVNYAIKSDYILNLISMLPDEIKIASQQNTLSLTLESQVERISPYVVQVQAK